MCPKETIESEEHDQDQQCYECFHAYVSININHLSSLQTIHVYLAKYPHNISSRIVINEKFVQKNVFSGFSVNDCEILPCIRDYTHSLLATYTQNPGNSRFEEEEQESVSLSPSPLSSFLPSAILPSVSWLFFSLAPSFFLSHHIAFMI